MRLLISERAEQDILDQVEWYGERGLHSVARRFQTAVLDALDAVIAMPQAGAPKTVGNPHLAGLRTWPIRSFDDFRLYYLFHPGQLTVVRVLHGRRDIGVLLED